ncbi:hypothetical protein VZT92_009178 [Zoarces viviparus]|uniref:Uncharacterized protein n=1 Tax=Zoarces viviparus TaxID=48416 RepID=A0AAW1FIU6_ZOAVI
MRRSEVSDPAWKSSIYWTPLSLAFTPPVSKRTHLIGQGSYVEQHNNRQRACAHFHVDSLNPWPAAALQKTVTAYLLYQALHNEKERRFFPRCSPRALLRE